ncbi:MAG: DUF362 domain-containing protein [Candidatus Cloacimonetes bacterium]|nr:DUF362 domain-containing protein [Candidatus Cloacimonadota bacterium]
MGKVYFSKNISPEAIWNLYQLVAFDEPGKIGIKLHFGEDGNHNFLEPGLTRLLTRNTKAHFVETNVLYLGKRHETESHLQLAREHGFNFAPLHILDADGEYTEPRQGYKHYQEVRLPLGIKEYDSFIIYSHFKGHIMSGFGGAIKNVGMGMASIPGKMAQHASRIPLIKGERCINCGICLQSCPGDAITLEPVKINYHTCIGCGKCIGVCPQRVFNIPWSSTSNHVFQERLVEYAAMIAENRNMVFINVIDRVSASCDCDSGAPAPFLNNVGILASRDMLGIDKASLDLVNSLTSEEDSFLTHSHTSGQHQLKYAAATGLGSLEYELIEQG